jgi:hypothetical protein
MSQNTTELRKKCWSQFEKSYQNFSNIFSTASVSEGCVSISITDFLQGMNLDHNVVVSGTPIKFICRCIDERCQQKRLPKERMESSEVVDLSLPGMGSLFTYAELCKHVEVILRKAKDNNIQTIDIYSHEGCGAAALARPKYEKITGKMDATAREIEEYFGKRAHDVFCAINKDEDFGINISDMQYQSADRMMHLSDDVCKDIHPALGVLVSDINGLDLSIDRLSVHDFLLKSELPFFLITDYGEEFDQPDNLSEVRWQSTAREVELAGHIMESEHGMGSDFQLPIIFLVNSPESKTRSKVLSRQIHKQMQQTKFANTMDQPMHHYFVTIEV